MKGLDFYKTFDRFEKLPADCKDGLGAFHWFKAIIGFSDDPVLILDCYQQIPAISVTDDLRQYAVFLNSNVLDLISPSDTPAYTTMCRTACSRNYKAAEFIKAEARTAETVELLFDNRSFSLIYRDYPWIATLMTPEMLEKASLANSLFMASLPDNQISKAALNKHLGFCHSPYTELKKSGMLHLAAGYLKAGRWPIASGPIASYQEPPSNLKKAFASILNVELEDTWALHMAYVMTYPIEEVIAAVKSPMHAKLLVEMYEEKELRLHIKRNRHLKAAMLEASLGL
jgi:hypothetical protein